MTHTAIATKTENTIIIEPNQRLSRSILWQRQRTYFEQQGVGAWQSGTVPHYITSNPYTANAYGQLIFGFLRDCHAVEAGSGNAAFPPLDPSQPVYIIELGAGSGRFGYHFLQKFLSGYRRSVLKDVPVKYIMTDFAEQTIEFWQSHPHLQPLVAAGALDFARYDVEENNELVLRQSGEVLSAETIRNPLVLVANYFFDSIPQDVFYIRDGTLYESLVTLTTTAVEADPADPDLLKRVETTYTHQPVSADYSDDPAFNDLLRDYQTQLDGATLVLPTVGLQCLRHFRELSGNRLLLLSADKGYYRIEDLSGRGAPALARHGSCISMSVNYHALGAYVRHQGGQVLHPAHRHASLAVCGFLLGDHPTGYPETGLAFEQAIEHGGPDDFFALKKGAEKHYEAFTLEQLLGYLRLSGYDANIFLGCFTVLMDHARSASPRQADMLREVVAQVWQTYFPLGEARDLAFHLGLLHFSLGDYAEALDYFQHSIQFSNVESEPDPGTLYNIGMCHYHLQETAAALACMTQALQLDPTFEAAEARAIELQAEMPRHTGVAV